MVGVPERLHTGSCARVPHPDGIIIPATGEPPPIRTPRHPIDDPAMAAQSPGRSPALHIPDGHQPIRARAGELAAIGTPGDVVERNRVALHDLQTLPTCNIPQTQGATCAPTEQSTAVGREGKAEHRTRT